MLRLSGVALSHVGLVRAGNEDSGYVSPSCMLVADGVGGAAAGEIASATAAYVVSAMSMAEAEPDPFALLRAGVRLAQEQINVGVLRDPARDGMATTLSAIATDGERFALLHVGDSRGYLFREGILTRITHDHTVVQRLVDEGSLAEQDVPYHPWRSVVTRSVNGTPTELGDLTELQLRPGDRVLLASDGLTDLVPDPDIERILGEHHDDAVAEALVEAALAAGGRDNVTVLLASVIEGRPVHADGVLVGAVRDPRNVVDAAAVRMPHSA
ncbi:MAG: protein phosphatase 2C domain-containing protein [Marmoricola sp.]